MKLTVLPATTRLQCFSNEKQISKVVKNQSTAREKLHASLKKSSKQHVKDNLLPRKTNENSVRKKITLVEKDMLN